MVALAEEFEVLVESERVSRAIQLNRVARIVLPAHVGILLGRGRGLELML
jgi:hypothetical protein